MLLQDADIGDRVAVDQDHVGEIALLQHAEFVAHAHNLAAEFGGRQDGLHGRHAQKVDEILDILGVGALWRPGEAVIPADEDANAAPMHLLHAVDRHFEFALVEHGDWRTRLDPVLARMLRGAHQPGETGRHEVTVLGGLQHVERFLVRKGCMVDVLNAVPNALLNRFRRARMRRDDLAPHAGFFAGHGDLFLGHRSIFGPGARDLLARQVELYGIDAVFDEGADGASHLLGSRHDDAEVETFMRDMTRRGIAKAADGRDLGSGRRIARPR